MKELEPKYNHRIVELDKMKKWEESNAFKWDLNNNEAKRYSIILPPPNITGRLHIGHAWDGTLQDVIVRHKKMHGYNVRWQAGMDHAGISMQRKVEEKMRKDGYDTKNLKKDDFLQEAFVWKEEHAKVISEQWRTLGFSLDSEWSRFTMDEGHCKFVSESFKKLYNDGLIYKGRKAINWDPVQLTAISNMESIPKTEKGKMHYFKYFIEGSEKYIEVATTRPETMYSDVAIGMNPQNPRLKELKDKVFINPFGVRLSVILDDYISLDKGSGFMKVSAHATEDVRMIEANGLAVIESIDDNGNMNEITGKYCGLSRVEARKLMVQDLEKSGHLIKSEDNVMEVPYSERSGALVEVMYKEQWFLDMKKVIAKIEDNSGKKIYELVNFVPERFRNTLKNWVKPETLTDWCISRQLLWGHQIPVWYSPSGEVSLEPQEGFVQDTDILDTWFSSGLWPLSTLNDTKGWCSEEGYYSNVLVTGYDIIFFWVARMIFQTGVIDNSIMPFRDVLLHGLVRAEDGRKMSKSLGNGVDPMDVVNEHGADALRWFLTTNSTPGQDLRYSSEKVISSWNFINKIWNTARFTMMNIGEIESFDLRSTSDIDEWILTKLSNLRKVVDKQMEQYEFGIVGNEIYRFVYNDFASNYIELSKVNLADANLAESTKATLRYVLIEICKMLHPFMPFVTEEIYSSITNESITNARWEQIDFASNVSNVDDLITVIGAIRQFRAENNVPNKKEILYNGFIGYEPYIERLVNARWSKDLSSDNVLLAADKIAITIDMSGLVDKEAAKAALDADIKRLKSEIERATKMLANPGFISKAPEDKIRAENEKLSSFKSQLDLATKKLEEL